MNSVEHVISTGAAMGRRADIDGWNLPRVITACTLVAPVIAALATGPEAAGQCQYEITAVIAAPPCPPPFNNVPATIGIALTEGPNPALVGSYYPCGASTVHSAFVWRASTGLVTLPRPAGVSSMGAYDISESGVIVGTYDSAERGFRGFVYEKGQYTELPPLPGGAWSEAFAINDAREVVGYRSIGPDGTVTPFNAFIWSAAEGFLDLGVMSGAHSTAMDINDQGQTVGWTGSGNITDAFMFQDGELTLLGPIPVRGALGTRAHAVSRDGVIVASARVQDEPGGPIRVLGFVWDEGEITVIEPLVGYDTSGGGDEVQD